MAFTGRIAAVVHKIQFFEFAFFGREGLGGELIEKVLKTVIGGWLTAADPDSHHHLAAARLAVPAIRNTGNRLMQRPDCLLMSTLPTRNSHRLSPLFEPLADRLEALSGYFIICHRRSPVPQTSKKTSCAIMSIHTGRTTQSQYRHVPFA